MKNLYPAMTKAPSDPSGYSPLRPAGSIRRTTTIDTIWPEGYGRPMAMTGTGRDYLTPLDGAPGRKLALDQFRMLSSPMREILAVEVEPHRENINMLIGCRAGSQSRSILAEVLAVDRKAGTPLFQLFDDFAGASLVAGWAWRLWVDDWDALIAKNGKPKHIGKGGNMEGVCAGFAPGASSLKADGSPRNDIQSMAAVPSLVHPDDPEGWHPLADQKGCAMRRARRIDIWVDDVVQIDIGFQDSANAPGGGRIAVHEYRVRATADLKSLELLSIDVDPRILPYRECPAASPNASKMIGVKLGDLRETVLEQLRGTVGCTHLNDVLRSMTDVPQLLARGGADIRH
ncbi:MAG: DUF2889 domain-containing protein [Parasphingorhabdus sp.]|uniref:DUF2889 domain-containing protein n=1 Tax=Parasphingorhabdus sp. TaxID=2709688 RepID=UPI003001B50D